MAHITIDSDTRLRYVLLYLNDRISVGKAAEELSISKTTFRSWVSNYQINGKYGLKVHHRHNRYPEITKLAAVRDYLSGGGSLLEVCRRFKIRSTKQLLDWISVYNGTNEIQDRSTAMNQKKTLEEKVIIAQWCLDNLSNYKLAAEKFGVKYSDAYRWTKSYLEYGEDGLRDYRGKQRKKERTDEVMQAQIEKLQKQIYALQMENDLLKKLKEIEGRNP